MDKTLSVLFGNSWRTSLIGYIAAIAQVLYPLMTAGNITLKQILWAAFTAVIGRIIKDAAATGKDNRTLIMITLLSAMSLLLFVPSAHAASDVTLAWDAPTGGATAVEVYQGNVCGIYTNTTVVPQPTNTVTLTGLADGFWCFAAKAVDAAGNKSDYSDTVSITFDTVAPQKPTGFKITVTVTAAP